MSKCPTCGADTTRIEHAVGGGSGVWQPVPGAAYTAGDLVIPPGAELMRRQPAAEPRPAHAVTALINAAGTFVVLAFAGGVLALLSWSWWPAKLGLAAGAILSVIVWLVSLQRHADLLWKIERITGLDINRDGATGEPQVIERYIPVNAQKTKILQEPVPIPPHDTAPGHEWITLREADARHSARMWRKRDLWAFVIAAHNADNWTRDYWQELGIGQKEWADLKSYLSRFNMWMCADSPTLAAWLSATGHPGTNEQQRTERTEDT